MKTVAFYTLGCKVNLYDTESMMRTFEDAGYQIIDFKTKADVYVVNTCTVTHEGARKSRQMVRQAKRRNPDSVVAVVGCYSQVAPEEVAQITGVDLVAGTKMRHELVTLVEEAKEAKLPLNCVGQMMETEEFEELPVEEYKERTRASIKVQEGCNQYCSYCIIPYARGPVRSRKPGNALREVRNLVETGVKEVVLTGIHLGAYGQDLGAEMNLVELIKMLLPIEGLERIRLSSIEITEVTDEMIQLMAAETKFCPHLHLPLQAGSDPILQAMNRPYTTNMFWREVKKLREQIPDIAITTDVMVGFPGETEELFSQTFDFVKEIGFSQLHVFKYSIRQGTPAAEMDNQLPKQIKTERSEKLRQLGDKLTLSYNDQFIGQVIPVLIEEERDQTTGMLNGVTPNYIRVYLSDGDDADRGNIVEVRLVNNYGDKAILGEKISV